MKILLLSTGLGMGGADQLVVTLAKALIARGHAVRVVSMIPLGTMGIEARDSGVPVTSLHIRRGTYDPRALIRLARMLREWQPDVLHSHMVHANLLARVSRLFWRVPVLISSAHSIVEGGRWREMAYRLTDPLCDMTTNVSVTATERYRDRKLAPAAKLCCLPNVVDTALFAPNAAERARMRRALGVKERFLWLAVGRFHASKDYPTMITAFQQVLSRHQESVLSVVGEGALQQATWELAEELHCSQSVRFLGVRRDVPALMNAADGYVLSSAWEGVPIVILEAASCGLPVVATAVGGNAQAVIDGQTGMIVPPGDPATLASAMCRIMEMPDIARVQMGHGARAHMLAQFSLSSRIIQLETLYASLLPSKRR